MNHPLSDILPMGSEVGPDGHLRLGGCDATELAGEYGTPLYVYDVGTMRSMGRDFV